MIGLVAALVGIFGAVGLRPSNNPPQAPPASRTAVKTTTGKPSLQPTISPTATAQPTPTPTSEPTPDVGMVLSWKLGTGELWQIDQVLVVGQRAPKSFWGAQWAWKAKTLSTGASMGLQTDGIRFDGTVGDQAVFSAVNANDSDGPGCDEFDGEVEELSCRVPYAVKAGRKIRLRIWRLQTDISGQWWGAWIIDAATGVGTRIGSLRVPGGASSAASYRQFVEYFGDTVLPAANVPRSAADFGAPQANMGDAEYERTGVFTGQRIGRRTTGSVTARKVAGTRGVRVTLGRGRSCPTGRTGPDCEAHVSRGPGG